MNRSNKQIEQWGIFEITLKSEKQYENPFKDVEVFAWFYNKNSKKRIKGFFDGEGTWKVRFMPEDIGKYVFLTQSTDVELDGRTGSFECVPASEKNHGPVKVHNTYHFRYADETPYFMLGTTVYAWYYRPEDVRKQTLASLQKYGFNKVRMLFFPKYLGGFDAIDLTYEPPCYPYIEDGESYSFEYFNVEYFREYEKRVGELMEIGVEADVILFHYYDFSRWGFDKMTDDEAAFFIEYLVARLSAYRNVWWALANEYNLYKNPTTFKIKALNDMRDWDRLGRLVMEEDPYNHLRSIHNYNGGDIYPDRDWLTHVSYQHHNTGALLLQLKYTYRKPVIAEEYKYEGNLPYAWGNYPAEQTMLAHWRAVMAGGYGTHGECFKIDDNKKDIFWTYGGNMVGESAPRLKFMLEIMETLPYSEMEPDFLYGDTRERYCLAKGIDVYFYLFDRHVEQKAARFGSKDRSEMYYEATVYDIWECKIIEKRRVKTVQAIFDIPGWIAVKLERCKD